MGLLDEAIREHLELKRRAGADAAEVARQEREALGPVVRGDPLTADLPPGQPVYESPPPGQFGPVVYEDDEYDDDYDEPGDPETAEHPTAPPVAGRPAHYPPPPPAVEPHPGEPAADDVLEQTPEFLQETPEHDRLWFEQAPPQEFDFDK